MEGKDLRRAKSDTEALWRSPFADVEAPWSASFDPPRVVMERIAELASPLTVLNLQLANSKWAAACKGKLHALHDSSLGELSAAVWEDARVLLDSGRWKRKFANAYVGVRIQLDCFVGHLASSFYTCETDWRSYERWESTWTDDESDDEDPRRLADRYVNRMTEVWQRNKRMHLEADVFSKFLFALAIFPEEMHDASEHFLDASGDIDGYGEAHRLNLSVFENMRHAERDDYSDTVRELWTRYWDRHAFYWDVAIGNESGLVRTYVRRSAAELYPVSKEPVDDLTESAPFDLGGLPFDLKERIAELVSPVSLLNLQLVNKEWAAACRGKMRRFENVAVGKLWAMSADEVRSRVSRLLSTGKYRVYANRLRLDLGVVGKISVSLFDVDYYGGDENIDPAEIRETLERFPEHALHGFVGTIVATLGYFDEETRFVSKIVDPYFDGRSYGLTIVSFHASNDTSSVHFDDDETPRGVWARYWEWARFSWLLTRPDGDFSNQCRKLDFFDLDLGVHEIPELYMHNSYDMDV
jgi:hypothetical protein